MPQRFLRCITAKLRRPEASANIKQSNESPTTKASCQPGGFGSPAAPGYTRQRCQKPPQPPKHPRRNMKKPVSDRALSSRRGRVKTAQDRGLSPRVHGPSGRRVTVAFRRSRPRRLFKKLRRHRRSGKLEPARLLSPATMGYTSICTYPLPPGRSDSPPKGIDE